MGKIVLLDELTINKIAAGEVIERPASVIKEMVENSIDAGATNITIDIRNGGISYIKITDNGKGIAKDDLEMTFERHATSKIRSAEDLNTVTSMGFRGEAMASIAAIANVELVSKTAEQDIGYKIVVEGGTILQKEETGCQTGTTVTVKNLFFNTPVRYKFLKKDYTETGYIEDVVTRLALVNPNIAFKLINSGKTIIQTAGNGDLKSVIYNIYGRDIAQGIVEVNYNYEDIIVKGVIGKPEIARSNRSNQLFFVNKRYVKDRILTAATEQAYKGQIEAGKFGFVVLNLEMNPSKVDVNVHPAKLEVRFEEESKVFQAIYHAIKDGLEKDPNYMPAETITKVDNIIIQSSNDYYPRKSIDTFEDEKPKGLGFFGWKKNKSVKNFGGNDTNIIEDLYKEKTGEEFPKFQSQNLSVEKQENDNTINNNEDAVNTSDVLDELRKMKNEIQKDNDIENQKRELKTEEVVTVKEEEIQSNLPDGKTYTYVGENKDKIEDLLRQLHPEIYNKKVEIKAPIEEENKTENVMDFQESNEESFQEQEVAEKIIPYAFKESSPEETKGESLEENIVVENKADNNQINQKFDLIRENLRKLDETQAIPTIEKLEPKMEIENLSTNDIETIKIPETLEVENNLEDNKTTELHDEITYEKVNIDDQETQKIPVVDIYNNINANSDRVEPEKENEKVEADKTYNNSYDDEQMPKAFQKADVSADIDAAADTSISLNDNDDEKIDNVAETSNSTSSEFSQMYEKLFGTAIISDEKTQAKDTRFEAVDILKDNVSVFEGISKYQKPIYKFIGVAFDNYIIAEIEKEMYIINVNTAKEKVIYEKIKKSYYNRTDKDSQMLLLPDIIELSSKEREIMKENQELLAEAGFSFEEFGDNTLKLTGVPTICMELDTKQLFIEILDEINTVARTSKQEKEEKFMGIIASKVAQNTPIKKSKEEIDGLMDELLVLPNPFELNYDKPIAIKMTKYDIERKFSRK